MSSVRDRLEAIWNDRSVYPNNLRAVQSYRCKAGRAVIEPPNRDAQARLKFARKYYVALKQREEQS